MAGGPHHEHGAGCRSGTARSLAARSPLIAQSRYDAPLQQGLVVELTGRCITAHMQQLQVKRSTPRHARCAERCARPGVVIFPEAGPVTPCKPLLNIAYTRPLRHKRPTRRDNRAVPEPTMLVLPARG